MYHAIESQSCEFDHVPILDQRLLMKLMWPIAKTDMVNHDSFLCQKDPEMHLPFPTQRINGPNYSSPGVTNFVGSCGQIMFIGDPKGLYKPCPIKCRPKDHQDWELC